MGMNDFAAAPIRTGYGTFVVQNTANPPKVINIFHYPILPNGGTRDLAKIPGVALSDIKSSLSKGEINHKLRTGDIIIIESDVELLEFNLNQQAFLYANNIQEGVQIGPAQFQYLWQQDIELDGVVDGINTMFTLPNDETFIVDDNHMIVVYKNGVKQLYLDDYLISENGGVNTGYNTVILFVAPSPTPSPADVITADYYVLNNGS